MPPETTTMTPPAYDEWGENAAHWLAHVGYSATVPAIHSRDGGTARRCPFLFYLTRRLGLVPAFSMPSPTLARGSWAHKYLEGVRLEPAVALDNYNRAVEARCKELADIAKILMLGDEKSLDIRARERRDAGAALGWLQAIGSLPLPAQQLPQGVFGWLRSPRIVPLGYELSVKYRDPKYPKTDLAGTFDLLYWVPSNKTVWVLDYKTTETPPLVWADMAPIAFQSLHYRHILHNLVQDGAFREKYGLPADVRMGGIVHVVIQKPSIEFGMNDRSYYYEAVGRTKGADGMYGSGFVHKDGNEWASTAFRRTGKDDVAPSDLSQGKPARFKTEDEAVQDLRACCGKTPEKVYSGEPEVPLYTKRCLDWYRGVGDYADKADERAKNPPVIITQVTRPLDEVEQIRYYQHLDYVYHYATCPAHPIKFPPTEQGMRGYNSKALNEYAPFFRLPVQDWPALIRQFNFTQSHLDVEVA